MDRRMFVVSMLSFAAGLRAPTTTAAGRVIAFEPDLAGVVEGKGWRIFNRGVSLIDLGAKSGVRFDERASEGFAWLNDYAFRDGSLEFDVRGKNVLQKSFVGVAFNAVDETAYDAVYFRPFNFKSDDPVRRAHAVQYISPPTYTWQKLRAEYPGKYEQPVQPVPNPEAWFHARVVVARQKISVFVNDAARPSLVVERLSGRRRAGRVGLWTGDGSGGDFANLRIIPAK